MGKAALWAEVQEARALSSAHTPAHGRRASLQPATVLHPGILASSIRASLILTLLAATWKKVSESCKKTDFAARPGAHWPGDLEKYIESF